MEKNLEFFARLELALKKSQKWPGTYLFKFIIPRERHEELLNLLPIGRIELRESRNGKYVSVNLTALMNNPEDVVKVYKRVQDIPGIVSL